MRPILFIIPTLPQGWFMPLAVAVAIIAIVVWTRHRFHRHGKSVALAGNVSGF